MAKIWHFLQTLLHSQSLLLVPFSSFILQNKEWLVNMLLQRYFHDHMLTANDVCTNLLQKCWQLKFWKIKCRKFIWNEVKCCQWIYAGIKNQGLKCCPWKNATEGTYVLTLLVRRAGPEGGFILSSTLVLQQPLVHMYQPLQESSETDT